MDTWPSHHCDCFFFFCFFFEHPIPDCVGCGSVIPNLLTCNRACNSHGKQWFFINSMSVHMSRKWSVGIEAGMNDQSDTMPKEQSCVCGLFLPLSIFSFLSSYSVSLLTATQQQWYENFFFIDIFWLYEHALFKDTHAQ